MAYNEARNVIGFKIDIRIIFNYNGSSHDLVNGEAAFHSADDKTVQDEGKLVREGKDMQDHFIDLL